VPGYVSHMFFPINRTQSMFSGLFDRSSALLVTESRRFTPRLIAPPSDLAFIPKKALSLPGLVQESMLAVRARFLRGKEPAPSDLARHEPSVATTVWRISTKSIETRR
jgi:hypothetical protein